jgi:hypothetical protein
MRWISFLLLCVCSALSPAWCQTPSSQEPEPPTSTNGKPSLDDTTTQALDRLATLLAEKRAERDAAVAKNGPTEAIDAEIRQLSWQFSSLAARFDVQDFEAPQQRQFDIRHELEDLIRPVIEWMKGLTSRLREVNELQERLALVAARQARVAQAVTAVERTRAALPSEAAAQTEITRELLQRWQPQVRRLNDERLVLEANLARLQEGAPSLLGSVRDGMRSFTRSSGTSLLLAIAVFVAVFLGLKAAVEALLRKSRFAKNFSARLLRVSLRVLVLLLAIGSALLVPYVRDDWVLLAIGVVFLFGAGWVVMRMAPQLFEQTRLLLNVGSVREGERILVDGLPFRVEALRFYTLLQNPDLQGGVLRVPLQYLIGKRSRPIGDGEPWFPCRVGDVVLLADGTSGPIQNQTPETVVVQHAGSPRSFPTVEFLKQAPRNLSRGFTATAVCLIGRELPTDALTIVTTELQQALGSELSAIAGAEAVGPVRVEFQQVTTNGFELLAQANCDGNAAPHFFALRRAMQQAFVRLCQRRGWPLPTPIPTASPQAEAG